MRGILVCILEHISWNTPSHPSSYVRACACMCVSVCICVWPTAVACGEARCVQSECGDGSPRQPVEWMTILDGESGIGCGYWGGCGYKRRAKP